MHRLGTALAPLAAASALLLAACGGGGDDAGRDPARSACLNLQPITWTGGAGQEPADWNDVALDPEGRLWLVGWAGGRLAGVELQRGSASRATVRQLGPDGQVLFDAGTSLDTPGTDAAEAIAFDGQGRVIVAARTTGSFDGRANAGPFDAVLAWRPLAQPGAAWQALQTGTERPERPRRLVASSAADGDVHVAGWDDDYIPTNHVAAWQDPVAWRFGALQANAAPRWRYQGGSVEPDVADGLAVDAAGNVYLGGGVQSGARRGMFLRKLDREGRALWTARYTAVAVDQISAVRLWPDGSVLVAGSVFGSFRGLPAAGQQDVFVARVAADDGRVLGAWQFGGAGSEWLTDMVVDREGRIVLFGETDGSVVPGVANAGGHDLFVLRLDAQGRLIGRAQWGTANDEFARRVAVDACGGIAAVGASAVAGAGGAPGRAGVLWFWRP